MRAVPFLSLLQAGLLTTGIVAQQIAFVGTNANAIATVSFDTKTGALKVIGNNTESSTPSWQEVSKDGKLLYSIEETSTEHALTSYSIAQDGKLKKLGSIKGLAGPVSLDMHPTQPIIITANYGSSSASAYATNSTGQFTHLGDFMFKMQGPGTVPDRQDAPHPHQALFDPTGKFVVMPDLGSDVIRVLKVESGPKFSVAPPNKVKPGTGPRHGVLYPAADKSKFYYVVGELSNTVTVMSVEYMVDTLKLTEIQTLSTLPDGQKGAAGELIISPSGKHLYASNRLDKIFPNSSSIASYSIDQMTGKLKLLEIFNGGVENIRHMSIHPSGKWFVAEGQNSNNIKVFSLDPESGKVNIEAKSTLEIEKPVCLQWWDNGAQDSEKKENETECEYD
ncbi:carboxy-cis,cis-muconate cyclase [Nannizzia gypsea CBS 118893]|uniref:Carboxy-cis,cis-muconate cyclase n=1 Tax=Arthroderma gypseum (strain ATCC MYA-4604 / CBS 118893) TaxID=535722 RepID=E5R0D7_ARTGP|nr:carboxy-cis,cis-muconate cyclase [Nannizzia gypsea CBS 118893]EFQ98333.1 carboxy-cis,cis-muconate cyclase [Nannizzia gypsea CBS 118893]